MASSAIGTDSSSVSPNIQTSSSSNGVSPTIKPTGAKLKPNGKQESNTFEIIIIAILIIVLLIFLTTTLYYLRRRAECFTYPSPWCYRDWICEDLPEDEQNRWDALRKLNLAGVPSTSGRCFIGDNGQTTSQCVNQWCPSGNNNNLCFAGPQASETCTGPGGSAPCSTPYSSLPPQPLSSSTSS